MDENKEIKDKNEQHKHEEKTYLTWVNKIGYGSGDIAGNVVYALLSAFVMIFLTDTVGMNAGVVGTLIAVSKLFDGVSDIFFGSLIDKTNTKMGKARPWMLYAMLSTVSRETYWNTQSKRRSQDLLFYLKVQ